MQPAARSGVRRLYGFGEFRLDAQRRRLSRGGELIPLPPKAIEILIVLVQNAGQILPRETLMRAVWGDTIVEDANLTVAISQLRRAFGQNGNAEEFIQTAPRVGYRFVADVDEITGKTVSLIVENGVSSSALAAAARSGNGSAAESARAGARANPESHRWISRRLISAAAFGLLCAALSLWLYHSRSAPQIEASTIGSLAVLPVKNLTGDPSNEYLAAGLTEGLIDALSRIEGLKVISRASVFRFKEREVDPRQIGQQLGVTAFIEGGLRKDQESTRASVRLVSTKDGRVLWRDNASGSSLSDLFAIEDQLAYNASAIIRPKQNQRDAGQKSPRYTTHPKAYQLYLKGRFFWNKRTPAGLGSAIEYFNQAISIDPSYAPAYAGLADSHALLSGYHVISPAEGFAKARAAAQTALQKDDTLAEAHVSLAFVSFGYDKDWGTAEKEYRRAIELNPNYATAHHWYAEFLSASGRHAEAEIEITRALEIDPLSAIINTDAGKLLCFSRRYDAAIRQLQRTLELEPDFIPAHRFLGVAYEQKRLYREALAELHRAGEISRNDPAIIAVLGHIHGSSGNRLEAERLLRQLQDLARSQYVSPHDLALIHIGLEEMDLAFASLKKAADDHIGRLVFINVDPLFAPLRSDARYTELLQQINLPRSSW